LVSGTVVAWPYAADAWALVTLKIPSGPARLTDEVKVAEAVRIGPAALKVPFRLGYLPSGLAPTAAQTEPRSPVNEGVITFNDDKLTVTVNRQGLDDAVPHCSGNDAWRSPCAPSWLLPRRQRGRRRTAAAARDPAGGSPSRSRGRTPTPTPC